MKDILDMRTMPVEMMLDIFSFVRRHEREKIGFRHSMLDGHPGLIMMYEPSTRTVNSFHMAMRWVGLEPLHWRPKGSSMEKRESLLDTALTFQAMGCKVLVIRHDMVTVPHNLATQLAIPVINAGDGVNAHPTQALIDVYTALDYFGGLLGRTVVMLGDVKHSRVAFSDALAFSAMGCKVIAAGHESLIPRGWIGDSFAEVTTDVDAAVAEADIVMPLRVQLNRCKELVDVIGINRQGFCAEYGLTPKRLALAKPHAIVMAPGPINQDTEIASEVAYSPRSLILKQVANGTPVRAAIIQLAATGRFADYEPCVRGTGWG